LAIRLAIFPLGAAEAVASCSLRDPNVLATAEANFAPVQANDEGFDVGKRHWKWQPPLKVLKRPSTTWCLSSLLAAAVAVRRRSFPAVRHFLDQLKLREVLLAVE